VSTASFSDLRLGEFLSAVGGPGLPGAGSVAAVTGALAASLVAMTARASTEVWPDAGAAVAQATSLRERLEALAREDAEAFAQALRSLEERDDSADMAITLDRAADVPLRMAEAAADVAALAREVAGRCDQQYSVDATAAATLAAAAARTAADLVAVNLTAVADDPRVRRAREAADEAARARPSP
jgi:formiminotetrahydrofolate cyclodeaminase